jgi:hypothetical protein
LPEAAVVVVALPVVVVAVVLELQHLKHYR